MKENEFYWAAGFFDGEGTISLHSDKVGHKEIVMAVSQVHREPLDRFLQAVGVGIVRGPYHYSQRPKNRPFYVWTAYKHQTQSVIDILLPRVSIIKRTQIERIQLDYKENLELRVYKTGSKALTCPKGHPWEPGNIYKINGEGRRCRICRLASNKIAAGRGAAQKMTELEDFEDE